MTKKAPVEHGAHSKHLDRGNATGDDGARRTLGHRVDRTSPPCGEVFELKKQKLKKGGISSER